MAAPGIRRALLLAGRRSGGDEMAAGHGLTHKALLSVGGEPMALRVIRALAGQRGIERIDVSADTPEVATELARLSARAGDGVAIEHHASGPSPAASVAAYLGDLPAGERVLITTADHALLTAEIVRRFLDECLLLDQHGGEPSALTVGAVTEAVYRSRFPAGKRTFVRLRDVAFSGANLFLARTPEATAVARFWVRLESERKKPWRLASHFGLKPLLLFLAGRLGVDRALSDVSRAVGARVTIVFLPFAEAALDVDRESDLEFARQVLAARERSVENSGQAS